MLNTDTGYKPALHERRPAGLQDKIEARFLEFQQRVSETGATGYGFIGAEGDYEFYQYSSVFERRVSAEEVIAFLAHQKDGLPLRVLDLGTGAGRFILEVNRKGHNARGITAHDFRLVQDERLAEIDKQDLTDDIYQVGDLHGLSRLPGVEGPYDLITSRYTMRHLLDPWSAIEQAGNLIGIGGVIALSQLDGRQSENTYYGESRMPPSIVMEAFEAAGFTDDFAFGIPYLDCKDALVMQRMSDDVPLRFPIEYLVDQ